MLLCKIGSAGDTGGNVIIITHYQNIEPRWKNDVISTYVTEPAHQSSLSRRRLLFNSLLMTVEVTICM